MRYLAGIWRLAIAALCFIGTSPAWHAVSLWAFLMYQIGFIAGIVMLWSGCASILRGVQPPALLRGFVLTYAFSLAAVHFFVTPAAEFGVPAQQVIPLERTGARVDCGGHARRRLLRIRTAPCVQAVYPLVWLVYLPLYERSRSRARTGSRIPAPRRTPTPTTISSSRNSPGRRGRGLPQDRRHLSRRRRGAVPVRPCASCEIGGRVGIRTIADGQILAARFSLPAIPPPYGLGLEWLAGVGCAGARWRQMTVEHIRSHSADVASRPMM